MADMLDVGTTWLGARLTASVSKSVTYRRGGQSVTWSATLGTSTFLSDPIPGEVQVRMETRDFLGTASSLGLTPQSGDTIEYTLGGSLAVFEVVQPSPDAAEYRFMDTGRTLIRIHTKQRDNPNE